MSYELIKSVQYLIDSGRGDHDRLTYILNTLKERKYLYLSDQKYIENLITEVQAEKKIQKPTNTSENVETVNQLRGEVKNLIQKIEKIEKERKEPDIRIAPVEQKKSYHQSENTTLALSIILGLVGLSGVGHMYLGKFSKGVGILVISLVLVGSSIASMAMPIPQISQNDEISRPLLGITALAGYVILYIYQIFDARKLCMIYNRYYAGDERPPLWW